MQLKFKLKQIQASQTRRPGKSEKGIPPSVEKVDLAILRFASDDNSSQVVIAVSPEEAKEYNVFSDYTITIKEAK